MTGSDVEATELFTTRLFGFWGVVPTQRPWEATKVMVSGLGPQEQALGVTMGKALLLHPDQERHSEWTGEMSVV